jgi:hypothetical protein
MAMFGPPRNEGLGSSAVFMELGVVWVKLTFGCWAWRVGVLLSWQNVRVDATGPGASLGTDADGTPRT